MVSAWRIASFTTTGEITFSCSNHLGDHPLAVPGFVLGRRTVMVVYGSVDSGVDFSALPSDAYLRPCCDVTLAVLWPVLPPATTCWSITARKRLC